MILLKQGVITNGISKLYIYLIEILKNKNPSLTILITDNIQKEDLKENKLIIVFENETFNLNEKNLRVKYYYFDLKNSDNFLEFREKINEIKKTIEGIENTKFFSKDLQIKYGDKKGVLENKNNFQIACIDVNYDVTRVKEMDYYEGKKEIMKNLNLKSEK